MLNTSTAGFLGLAASVIHHLWSTSRFMADSVAMVRNLWYHLLHQEHVIWLDTTLTGVLDLRKVKIGTNVNDRKQQTSMQ